MSQVLGFRRRISAPEQGLRFVRQRLNKRRRGGYRTAKNRFLSGKSAGGFAAFLDPRGSIVKYNGPGMMPMTFETNQVFNATASLTTAGGFYDWVYRGNSVYDPDYTLGGTTASGFDLFTRVYTFYKVLSSTIEVNTVNNDTDDPVHVTVIPNCISASFVVGDVNDIPAQPFTRDIIVTNQAGQGNIHHYGQTKTLFSVKDIDDVAFDGTATTNPTNAWFWHVVFSNRSTNALSTEANVKISYRVRWYGLKALTQTH